MGGSARSEIKKEGMKHSHYFKDVSHLKLIDVYRVIELWEVEDPCIQHALKKLLVAGKRGAKDEAKDIQEAIDTLERWKAMREEDAGGVDYDNTIASDGEGWFLASDYMAFVADDVHYDIKYADGSVVFSKPGKCVSGYSGVKYIRPHRGFMP